MAIFMLKILRFYTNDKSSVNHFPLLIFVRRKSVLTVFFIALLAHCSSHLKASESLIIFVHIFSIDRLHVALDHILLM